MKINKVYLYGQILSEPGLSYNENGPFSANMALKVLRRRGSPDEVARPVNERLLVDTPIIRTKNIAAIEKIKDFKQGDMINLVGVVVTKEILKKTNCPHCGVRNEFEGTIFYIEPIYLRRIVSGLSTEDGFRELHNNMEISNNVYLAGQLCRDLTLYQDGSKSVAQYQIACNRRYRIKEDPPGTETDYPWIKSYGEMAVENSKALAMGAEVFIDGSIQTREYRKKMVCSECGKEYLIMDNTAEIVPYYVGYLKNCNLPDSTHENESAPEETE